jgi:hypothetical protein
MTRDIPNRFALGINPSFGGINSTDASNFAALVFSEFH